jgi:Tol biopolymer transport system component
VGKQRLLVAACLVSALVGASALAVIMPRQSEAAPSIGNGEIAFSTPVNGVNQVFTVNPDGTGLRQVTHVASDAGADGISWSSDGRSLVYTLSQGDNDRIVTSRADGSDLTMVSPPCTGTCLGDDNPVYSPDGKKIAFERVFGTDNEPPSVVAIFTMNADGSDPTQLTQTSTPTSTEDHQPQWSPDGTKIAFYRLNTTATPHNKGAIEIMNADGSNIRQLTPFRIDAADPHWSPDGKRLLFNTYANPTVGRSANLFTMRADGTHRETLTHYTGGTLQAFADDWSPDGSSILFHRVAFSGTDTQVGHFYVMNLRRKHIRQLGHVLITGHSRAAWGK